MSDHRIETLLHVQPLFQGSVFEWEKTVQNTRVSLTAFRLFVGVSEHVFKDALHANSLKRLAGG